METQTVQTKARPMIFVRYATTMDSDEIGKKMGEAFQTLGSFIGEQSIDVVGPPLAVYHDYSDSGMTMDIGFPVAAAALAKATDPIKVGETPAGKAIKVIHKGSYDGLRDTYGEIEADFKSKGMAMSPVAWEVYLNSPDETPADELITEIFMKVE